MHTSAGILKPNTVVNPRSIAYDKGVRRGHKASIDEAITSEKQIVLVPELYQKDNELEFWFIAGWEKGYKYGL